MVGIVTHVRELAERMPVRFEVAKGATQLVAWSGWRRDDALRRRELGARTTASPPTRTHLDETERPQVDAAIEAPRSSRGTVHASGGDTPTPEHLLFVDGVRRIDARVWYHDGDDRPSRRLRVRRRRLGRVPWIRSATSHEVRVGAAGSSPRSAARAGPIVTRHGTYEYFPCAGDSARGRSTSASTNR